MNTQNQDNIIAELNARIAELTAKSVPSEIQKKKKVLASYRTYLNNPDKYGKCKQVTYEEIKSLLADGMELDNLDECLIQLSKNKWIETINKLEIEIAELEGK